MENIGFGHQNEYFKSTALPRAFYSEIDNNEISKALLGKVLVRLDPFPIGGIIIETESYPGKDDKASHHWGNKNTARTKTIFCETKGLLYVYMIYGLHYCFGITSGDGNEHHNVTCIRALEPIFGIEEIKKRRKTDKVRNLLSGPAKVAKALDITKKEDGKDTVESNILICDFKDGKEYEIESSERIGIGDHKDGYREKQWRYYIKGSKFLSK